MGNAKSASFEVEHLPGEKNRRVRSNERFSFSRSYEDHIHHPQRPVSLYASVYAESSTSDFSKESETLSTLSSTSTTENHDHGVFERSKTAPMIIPEIVEPEEATKPVASRVRSKSWDPEPSRVDSFFDQIVEAIEQEAEKTSPTPSRQSPMTQRARRENYHKKRWSTMFT